MLDRNLRPNLPQVGKNILRGILFDFLYGCKSVTDSKVDASDDSRDLPVLTDHFSKLRVHTCSLSLQSYTVQASLPCHMNLCSQLLVIRSGARYQPPMDIKVHSLI